VSDFTGGDKEFEGLNRMYAEREDKLANRVEKAV